MSTQSNQELINASMAFLAYAGESLAVSSNTVFETAQLFDKILPTYPHLNNDWQVVWGPALHLSDEIITKKQANLTFVAQSRSTPSSYIVSTRGTVSDNIWEWLSQDLAVDFFAWPTPESTAITPYVSKATADALSVVLKTIPPTDTPFGFKPLPGAGQSLASFLAGLTGFGPIEICFAGHSLGGAIASALALWFKQAQGKAQIPNNKIFNPMPAWDVNADATIACVSLAEATPGDTVFSQYFEELIGPNFDRIFNTHDVVPHGFDELKQLPSLYAPDIALEELEKLALEGFEAKVLIAEKKIKSKFAVLPNGNPFTCPINMAHASYASQALYQHIDAYEQQFGLPDNF